VAIEKSITLILNKAAGGLSENQERFLTIAARNLKRLTILVNDLLDLSKLEAGKMQIKSRLSSIDKVICDSVESFSNWAKTKSVSLEKKVEEGLPEINMDPDRIIQVLNNLVGNAIKFSSDNGRVIIEAALCKEDRQVEVSVSDNGIGISKEDIPRVFDKFFQVGERISTDLNGTGIGLSIAKEIVELHGGTIWAESQKGQGAKFSFRLPIAGNTVTGG
jgi:signal transduction histidine kinase